MSCWLLSSRHVASIACYAGIVALKDLDPDRVAIDLRRLNNASMRERYGSAPEAFGADTIAPRGASLADRKAMAIAEAWRAMVHMDPRERAARCVQWIDCLRYQCDEAPDTPANRRTNAMLDQIYAHALAESKGLHEVAPFKSVWSI